MPARNFFRMVATRTMKNSSRLVPVMARNLTRSSSGCDAILRLREHALVERQPAQLSIDIERRAAEVVRVEIRPVLQRLGRRRRRRLRLARRLRGRRLTAVGGGHRQISIPYGCNGIRIDGSGPDLDHRITERF